MDAPQRLTPQMTSRKLQAYGFIRRYIGEHEEGPSYGEIAAALGVTRERARDLVRALDRDGKIVRTPGARRGIRLPMPAGVADIQAAIAQLRAAGWTVDDDALALARANPFTITPLRMIPDFEQLGGVEVGSTPDAPSQRPRGGSRSLSRARKRAGETKEVEAGSRAA